jgi:hypothetical protein
VNGNTSSSSHPSITARPTHIEKQRFVEVAAARGISESALALIAIRSLLESNPPPTDGAATESRRQPATDRITIRLRPGDHRALDQRATQLGMRTSRYLAALVRAHIAASPPLTVDEIAVLKHGVAVLAQLGRALSRTAHELRSAGTLPPELQKELTLTRTVVAALEQRTHDIARSALTTWESHYD